LVRLEAPRFFVERDEVVLSANVHNYLSKTKTVHAELILPAALFTPLGDTGRAQPLPRGSGRSEGNGGTARAGAGDGLLHLFAEATVKANGEHRFDWPVRAKLAGLAQITIKALTDEESDGMRLAFPVLVHGVNKTIAQSGSYRVAQDGKRVLQLELPRDIDPGWIFRRWRPRHECRPQLAGRCGSGPARQPIHRGHQEQPHSQSRYEWIHHNAGGQWHKCLRR
jgi:hypothetical protein